MYRATAALLICITYLGFAQSSSDIYEDVIDGTSSRADVSSRRTMLQSYGSSRNNAVTTTTPGSSSSSALAPRGSDCFIASSPYSNLDCNQVGTGTSAQIIPGCCSSTSTSSSTMCNTFDNAGAIQCSASARPYPSCCTLRNQPASACRVAPSTSSTLTCSGDEPARGCCGSRTSTSCNVNTSLTSQGQCSSSQYDACCPAR